MSNNQVQKSTIILDGNQADSELKSLKGSVDKYTMSMQKARKANDNSGFQKAQRSFKAAKKELGAYTRTVVDVKEVLNNLNGTSLKKLSSTQRKLTSELNIMNKTTKQEISLYNQKVASLKLVKAQMTKVRTEMTATTATSQNFMQKFNGAFNKFSMLAMTAVAAVIGIVTALRAAVDIANEFESSIANLSALTGLAGDNLDYLKNRALDFSGSTTEAGIRITQSAQEIIDAYTQMGSKRPELLQNKEDLASVTEQAILLSAAANMELVPATLALATSLNMFNASADEAPRYINAIAASSRAGAADVNFINDMMSKFGTSAHMASISVEEALAAAETIAPKFAVASKAGTQLKNVFLNLQIGSDKYNPKVVGLSQALDNLAAAHLSVNDKRKMFGRENIDAAETLITLRGEYGRYLEAVTDTDVALVQAGINTDTQKAKLMTYKAALEKVTIKLGQELVPVLTFTTSSFGKIIRSVTILVKFFKEYYREITVLTAAVVTYYTVLAIQTRWAKIATASQLLYNGVLKAYTFLMEVVTGKTKLATAWTRIWNATLKLNPIVFLISALIAAATAIYMFSEKISAAEKAQKRLNKAALDAKNSINEQKVELELLLSVASDELASKQARLEAMKKLRLLSDEYLGDLTLEKIGTEEGTKALEDYVVALEQKARMEANTAELVAIEKELNDHRSTKSKEQLKWYQKIYAAALTGSNYELATEYKKDVAAQNYLDKEQEILETKRLFYETIKNGEAGINFKKKPDAPETKTEENLRVYQDQLDKLKLDRQDISKDNIEGLKINAKDIELLQEKIKLLDAIGRTEKETAKSKKDTVADNKTEIQFRKWRSKELKKYRDEDVKALKQKHQQELNIDETAYNMQMLLLGNNEKAKEELTDEFNAKELRRKIEHLKELRYLLEQTMAETTTSSIYLSDEERDEIIAKTKEIELAISALKLLLEDEESEDEEVSLMTKMLFGDDSEEAALEEKIAAIGSLAMDAFASIDQIITNSEKRQLMEFEKNNDKKRKSLDKRLAAGTISEQRYAQKLEELDIALDDKKRKLAYEQAKRQKAGALMSAIINTAVAVTGALGNPVGPAGIIMGIIVGALGALQIGAIASEPLPQYADGNYMNVVGADDKKKYRAKVGNNKTRLVKSPTYEPGLGLVGEQANELVFSGRDTNTILNTPELVQAIHQTLGIPQFSEGNAKEIIRENNTITETFTDPLLISLMQDINDRLAIPAKAHLVASEDYINLHNESVKDFEKFEEMVN